MWLRKIRKILLLIVAGVILLIILTLKGVDTSPIENNNYYLSTKKALDTLQINKKKGTNYYIGWSKSNITPHESLDMAGYKPRGKSDSIADSLYVRVLYISNDELETAIVSYDLLMVHPLLVKRVTEKLESENQNISIYYSATHTHNSFGNWAPDLASKFVLGAYKDSVVESIANKTVRSILEARENNQKGELSYFEFHNPSQVKYRLKLDNGIVDDLIRGVKIKRVDSSEAILTTYSAHATTLRRKTNYLSADYPGKLNTLLEEQVDFSIFCAGVVGSHGPDLKSKPESISTKNVYAFNMAQIILDSIPYVLKRDANFINELS